MATNPQSISTRVFPAGTLNMLSREEVERLHSASRGDLKELLRRCALAVLNSGSNIDDAETLLSLHEDFDIDVQQTNRGIRLSLTNAPAIAFVDGEMILGIQELLSAVVRDIVYYDAEILGNDVVNLESSEGITNGVFELLRNAALVQAGTEPNNVVCWGGHSISP